MDYDTFDMLMVFLHGLIRKLLEFIDIVMYM